MIIFFVSFAECNANSIQCFLNDACNDEYKQLKLEVSAIKQTLQLLDTIKPMKKNIESLQIQMQMRYGEIHKLKDGINLTHLKKYMIRKLILFY